MESSARGGDDEQHARRRARPSRPPRRATAPCGRRRAARSLPSGEHEDADARDEVVGAVEERRAESCGPSERNRPPIDQDDRTPSAASTNVRRSSGGTLGRWGVRREPARSLDRLRHQQRADEGDREEDEHDDVGQDARGGGELDERRARRGRRGPCRPALATPLVRPDAGRVAARVQIQQRGAGGAEREPGRDALDAARDEQPGDRAGAHEDHRRAHEHRRARRAGRAGARPGRTRCRRAAAPPGRRTRTSRRRASARQGRSPTARGRSRTAATACPRRTARAR